LDERAVASCTLNLQHCLLNLFSFWNEKAMQQRREQLIAYMYILAEQSLQSHVLAYSSNSQAYRPDTDRLCIVLGDLDARSVSLLVFTDLSLRRKSVQNITRSGVGKCTTTSRMYFHSQCPPSWSDKVKHCGQPEAVLFSRFTIRSTSQNRDTLSLVHRFANRIASQRRLFTTCREQAPQRLVTVLQTISDTSLLRSAYARSVFQMSSWRCWRETKSQT
jgi:hypothetical protein